MAMYGQTAPPAYSGPVYGQETAPDPGTPYGVQSGGLYPLAMEIATKLNIPLWQILLQFGRDPASIATFATRAGVEPPAPQQQSVGSALTAAPPPAVPQANPAAPPAAPPATNANFDARFGAGTGAPAEPVTGPVAPEAAPAP